MNVDLTWGTFLYVASAIGIIWTAAKCIGEARKAVSKPFEENETRMNKIESSIDNNKKRMDNLERKQNDIADDVRQLLSATVVMLSHMESGNNTGEIRQKHSELSEYLIKKRG